MRLIIILLIVGIYQSTHAQLPKLKWSYELGAPAFGSAAAADLDSDGYYEIVLSTYTNDGRAHCINAEDGSALWTFDLSGCGDVAPIIYDVDNDGELEVIINGSCNPRIFCINGMTGALEWSRASGGGDSPPTIADMDNDGTMEILFGNFSGELIILNGEDGSLDKSIQVINPAGALQTAPTLVDIDNDGFQEIILANYFNVHGLYVWAYDYATATILWSNKQTNEDASFHAYHGGAVADIDQDGKAEYVLGSNAGYIHAINLEDGSDLWKIEPPGANMTAVTIADLDRNGTLEVVFNTNDNETFDSGIWIVNGVDGSEAWSYPISFSSFRGSSVSDINGNGTLDLISGHFFGKLRAIEAFEGLLWEYDLSDHFSPDVPYVQADHQPLIADFDKDGKIDVFMAAGYGTYTPDKLNTGSAFLFEGGNGLCPEWLMFRQNIERTGYLSDEDIIENCQSNNVSEIKQNEGFEFMISPNPTEGSINLSLELTHSAKTRIVLFDAQARTYLEKSFNLSPGEQKIQLQSPEAKGVYIVKVFIEGRGYKLKRFIKV